MSSAGPSSAWSDCLNNPFCTGDSGISPIVVHIVILFITIFLVYILRSDRFFVGLLVLWDFNLWAFAFVASVPFWYALVAFDLWAMNKYLNTKKNAVVDEAAAIDDDAQENFMPGVAAELSKHHTDDEGGDDNSGSSEDDVEKANHFRRASMLANNNPY